MKKKKNPQITIRELRSPYHNDKGDEFKDRIRKYLDDPEHIVTIDKRTYYKIMELTEFHIEGRNYSMLAHVDSNFSIKIGDILIDENEHTFKFVGCAMIRYHQDQYPECIKVSDLLLEGDPDTIGEYLAFYQRPSNEGE